MRRLTVLPPAATNGGATPGGDPASSGGATLVAGGCGSGDPAWPERKPRWLKVRAPGGESYRALKQMMRSLGLNSVCEEARCPNIGECWDSGTATFLIMGDKCTRNCPYCAIAHGRPEELDEDEPRRVAEMIEQLRLRHVVITSVDRDDLPDGGARIFAWTIEEIRDRLPGCSIEVLTPDFRGDPDAIATVIAARPEIFNHNMETVRRLHRTARPGGRYRRSLDVLARGRELDPGVLIKTGIMLGLGETVDDVREFMDDALAAGVQILTLGQYLRPTERHMPVDRYVSPEEFAGWKRVGEELGFLHVESGPLVRSSYHAREQVEELRARAGIA
ncbi:MAG: lipoyl synthase [Gemmatimonadota bacterium]